MPRGPQQRTSHGEIIFSDVRYSYCLWLAIYLTVSLIVVARSTVTSWEHEPVSHVILIPVQLLVHLVSTLRFSRHGLPAGIRSRLLACYLTKCLQFFQSWFLFPVSDCSRILIEQIHAS